MLDFEKGYRILVAAGVEDPSFREVRDLVIAITPGVSAPPEPAPPEPAPPDLPAEPVAQEPAPLPAEPPDLPAVRMEADPTVIPPSPKRSPPPDQGKKPTFGALRHHELDALFAELHSNRGIRVPSMGLDIAERLGHMRQGRDGHWEITDVGRRVRDNGRDRPLEEDPRFLEFARALMRGPLTCAGVLLATERTANWESLGAPERDRLRVEVQDHFTKLRYARKVERYRARRGREYLWRLTETGRRWVSESIQTRFRELG